MSYREIFQSNNNDLQTILDTINELPEAGGVDLPTLTNEGTDADLLSGKQLIDQNGNIVTGTIPSQAAKTVTPSEKSQTAVSSGVYTTGTITVGAIPDGYMVGNEISAQDTLIAQIVSALEGKTGSSGGSGSTSMEDSLIQGPLQHYENNRITQIYYGAFSTRPDINSVSFLNVQKICPYAFYQCGNLTSINFPKATTIEMAAFGGCTKIVKMTFPMLTNFDANGTFWYCSKLEILDFPSLEKICNHPSIIGHCNSLKALILRNVNNVVFLEGAGNNPVKLTETPIASGTGYIYVPRSLLSQYQSATDWSNYTSQFRALEDYTIDGTTTGALDETKI